MDKKTSIFLIGNYQLDKQESMIRFAKLLHAGFTEAGYTTEIWWPKAIVGASLKTTATGYRKWIGYIDKWILFPFILRSKVKKAIQENPDARFHVCDHANSPYLNHLPSGKTGITCHDVLAIRGSMGFADAFAPSSRTGKILQKWILKNLIQANKIACNSKHTYSQLKALAGEKGVLPKDWQVIHLSYNSEYKKIPVAEAIALTTEAGIKQDMPFILHVGNGHIRKNRIFLLDVMTAFKNNWPGYLCLAGNVNDSALVDRIKELNLEQRVILLSKPANHILCALYNRCEAFMYPSFSEGFPWPTIEAQSCGAPVITSDIEPMPEISGEGALHVNPTDAPAFANAFLALQDSFFRNKLIEKGAANCAKYAPPKMINDYLAFHGLARLNQDRFY